jgi:hypothetical protein
MTVSELLGKVRTNALAAELGVDPSTVSKWKERESVPGEYWRGVVDFAVARGVNEITLERLASAHSRPSVEARA